MGTEMSGSSDHAVDGTESSHYVPALDGIRGLAIGLVLFFHFFDRRAFYDVAPTLALDQWVMRLVSLGWAGVDLFFVLSGLLITGILYDAKGEPAYLRNFFARRALRIVPLYATFLVAIILIAPLVFRDDRSLQILWGNQAWYWTYSVNWWAAIDPLTDRGAYSNGHLWSLSVEEQFYLIWPAIVLLASRRVLVGVCMFCVVGAFAFRVALINDVSPINALGISNVLSAYTLMPARMDALAIGGLLALAIRTPLPLSHLKTSAFAALATGAVALVVLLITRGEFYHFDPWIQTVGYSSTALLFGGLILIVLTSPPASLLRRPLTHPVLRFLGRYSYGLYVVHWIIGVLLIKILTRHGDLPSLFHSQIPARLGFLALGCAVSLAVAWVSWHVIESPFLRLKRYFRDRPVMSENGSSPLPLASPVHEL